MESIHDLPGLETWFLFLNLLHCEALDRKLNTIYTGEIMGISVLCDLATAAEN